MAFGSLAEAGLAERGLHPGELEALGCCSGGVLGCAVLWPLGFALGGSTAHPVVPMVEGCDWFPFCASGLPALSGLVEGWS